MRAKLAKLMAGRNGADDLARFVTVLAGLSFLLSMLLPGVISRMLWAVALTGLGYSYFRILSHNLGKRRDENARFLQIMSEVKAYFRGVRERSAQRRDYKFFRCPACKTILRVPRGKGRVKIICRKCGTSFIKKT